MLGNAGECWGMLGDAGDCWGMLGNAVGMLGNAGSVSVVEAARSAAEHHWRW